VVSRCRRLFVGLLLCTTGPPVAKVSLFQTSTRYQDEHLIVLTRPVGIALPVQRAARDDPRSRNHYRHTSKSPASTSCNITANLTSQLLLPAPYFLGSRESAKRYFASAFDLGREFMFKWSVNWRWVGEERFLSPEFKWGLLGSHVSGPRHLASNACIDVL
jgi:hypothetical protein